MSVRRLSWPGPCLIWQVDLDSPPNPESLASLSPAEQERAARFVFARDGARYRAAHAALRQLLADETGIAAQRLEFAFGEFGKPALARSAPGLHFNLSHSRSMGLIAISHGAEVGVDVELQRPMPDALELAASYFTPHEIDTLQALPPGARDHAFLVGWTRKEAFLKALGLGISVDLRTVDVGLDGAARSVAYMAGDRRRTLRVAAIVPAPGAVGAVALLDADGADGDAGAFGTASLEFSS
ncbi:MAG TPA: 4'-phosphopantetheinyl transferase superfamily protein [Variovorax sp.]